MTILNVINEEKICVITPVIQGHIFFTSHITSTFVTITFLFKVSQFVFMFHI
jgi:hypothetical protein